jgi:hypothetical protein
MSFNWVWHTLSSFIVVNLFIIRNFNVFQNGQLFINKIFVTITPYRVEIIPAVGTQSFARVGT